MISPFPNSERANRGPRCLLLVFSRQRKTHTHRCLNFDHARQQQDFIWSWVGPLIKLISNIFTSVFHSDIRSAFILGKGSFISAPFHDEGQLVDYITRRVNTSEQRVNRSSLFSQGAVTINHQLFSKGHRHKHQQFFITKQNLSSTFTCFPFLNN